jgi:lysine-specific demethylase/histidyl-hydroxylase NO66
VSSDLELLRSLVGDLDRFGAAHRDRRPLRTRATTDLGHLLDVDEVERLLLAAARRPTFRLVQDGTTLPPERSTRTLRLGGRAVDDAADLARIADAVGGGATLVLQALQRTSLPIARFCRSLERATSHPVQANAYLTPAGGSGLAAHGDDHDVLVLQLAGTKAWTIDGLGSLRLEAGDVLYLPAGTRHAAEAQTEASLHLTVGLLGVTYGQVIRRALDLLGPDDLDRPLPLGFARPDAAVALTDGLAAVLAASAAALGGADPVALAASEAERAARRRRPLLTGHLAAVLGVDRLGLDDEVRRRADQPAGVAVDDDGRIVLELADRRVLLPPVARPAIEALLTGGSLSIRSLPGIDDDSKLVLARRLVREGLLVPVAATQDEDGDVVGA